MRCTVVPSQPSTYQIGKSFPRAGRPSTMPGNQPARSAPYSTMIKAFLMNKNDLTNSEKQLTAYYQALRGDPCQGVLMS
jgi:hypothetical protein